MTAGDQVLAVAGGDAANPTITGLHDLYVRGSKDRERLHAAVAAPDLTDGWRIWAQKRLDDLDRG